MTNVERALMISEQVHRNQTYGIYPYMYHINMVVELSQEFGMSEQLQITAALHDTLEDGSISYKDIELAFNEDIAEWVFALSGYGRNRKERNANAYSKIQQYESAIAIKLCDRIANMNHSKQYTPKLFKMYMNEYDSFISGIIPTSGPLPWNASVYKVALNKLNHIYYNTSV